VYFDIVAVAYRPEPIMEGVSSYGTVLLVAAVTPLPFHAMMLNFMFLGTACMDPLVHTQPKHEEGREVRSSKPHAM